MIIKVYVGGPISGRSDYNAPAFAQAATMLRMLGYAVVSPIEEDIRIYGSLEEAGKRPWQEHLARDITLVPTCDAIALLPGWRESKGTNLELNVARVFGLDVLDAETGFPMTDEQIDAEPRPGNDPHREVPRTYEADYARAKELGLAGVLSPLLSSSKMSTTQLDSGETFQRFEDHPERHVYETGGIKDNKGKARIDLIPPDAIFAIAEVLTFGARKYRTWNWARGLPWGDTFASLQRHLWAWANGEDVDPETGLSHLAHANCQAMFLLTFAIRDVGDDDRWKWAASQITTVPA